MPPSPSGPIRRAQLIAPFGVGAMVMVPGGTSLIIAGLDYWYKTNHHVELDEYKFQEWRLQQLLDVDHFRLPPDYREPWRHRQEIPNAYVTIPALRFPTWHFCPDCHLLTEWPPTLRGTAGRVKCPECDGKKKLRYMFQVPFVAMCQNGHLQDFPWREWVHRSSSPDCHAPLRLHATGSATLAGQVVSCDCGIPSRNLSGITSADNGGSVLSSKLDSSGEKYLCQAYKPWLGPGAHDRCSAPLRGSLRNAANLYYSHVRSAIYLPPVKGEKLQELMRLLEKPPLSSLVHTARTLGMPTAELATFAKGQHKTLLLRYEVTAIAAAIEGSFEAVAKVSDGIPDDQLSDDTESAFRKEEYDALLSERDEPFLRTRKKPLNAYNDVISKYFSSITLIDKLKETRVMIGFTRVFPENNLSLHELKSMLFLDGEKHVNSSWLPAYVVYGEGIFLQFDSLRLREWEEQENVQRRMSRLAQRYNHVRQERGLSERRITPRFVLIHTVAHLLINQLTFDCGYSSASLRERLYVSGASHSGMAGVLVYTANGDSEGTMGGLVRMGKPGNIEPVLQKAIEQARWCSSDPVCMEMGQYGQGPDSCNLAACHNCALVPETACEEFNRFLDRALVTGSHQDPTLGYFH